MTNYESIKGLSPEELAWFLMAYNDNCRCCIYKRLNEKGLFDAEETLECYETHCAKDQSSDDTCVDGYMKWLLSETEEPDDKRLFALCVNNRVISEFNRMNEGNKDYKYHHRVAYRDGPAVGIEEWDPLDEPDLPFR